MTWKSGKRYFDSYLGLAKAAHLSELLLDELNAEDDNEEIAYYTSADVFSYMLPEKCKEEDKKDDRLGKLTVMHLSYMNDPNEGKLCKRRFMVHRMELFKKAASRWTSPLYS